MKNIVNINKNDLVKAQTEVIFQYQLLFEKLYNQIAEANTIIENLEANNQELTWVTEGLGKDIIGLTEELKKK